MFYYFGYGSNLSVISLLAKGVTPLNSEPAILDGWRVVFDIPDFFRIEGGTGNIQPAEDESVHGVLHACRDEHLEALDRIEALGISYQRIEATVVTYGGRRVRAYVYVGITSILDPRCRPSERYRNILVQGAEHMQLDASYVEALRRVPTAPRPVRPRFQPPEEPAETLTMEELKRRPMHTALAGHVFDMSEARPEHAYLQKLLAGKDVTLLFLKRMDTSEGRETMADIRAGRLSPAQLDYLNVYLHEFALEYRYAGRLEMPEITREMIATPIGVEARPPTIRPHSWRPTPLFAPDPTTGAVPARHVLRMATETNERLGHENMGFLSESHGYMPVEEPRRALDPAFAAWDQAAAELPRLYASLRVRRELEDLPLLDAGPESLPDDQLLRAGAVLAILSHAYWYVESSPPDRLPEPLSRPWAEVRRRLGRGPEVLSYIDLIVYNWRLLDAGRPDPLRVDNMRLLLPTVDNKEERIFYLTQAEILARCSPIVGAAVRAQEAASSDDPEALESALLTIIGCLQSVVHESLLHINPNPSSPTYVDPVVWAKTVAPFAVPFQEGIQGPSGTSSPIFNTLDVFFGRKSYETFLGREIRQLRDVYPPFWRRFLAALQEVSVAQYVAEKGNPHLAGLLQEAFETYAGENGFLGRHRMKVFGYLELAFKVGRSVTIGGFSGVFRDRTWEQVDSELEVSRTERTSSFPRTCHHALVKSVEPPDPDAAEGLTHVVLDVSRTGLRWEAGDRCGVLAESSPDLVRRTLAALGARGDESAALTDEWREAVTLRAGYEDRTELTVEEILRFGRIRPVVPRVAEALHATTQNERLEQAIREQSFERWELWNLLELLAEDGFEVQRLWNGALGDDALCRVVPPETFRMYSISSVMSGAQVAPPNELGLTVGRVRYRADGVERRGTASHFLACADGRAEPVSIVVQHPARFTLPKDPKVPIIMIAGGSGISPFRGFLVERTRQINAGESWLMLAMRTRQYLSPYEAELTSAMQSGKLRLRVGFSREDVAVSYVAGDDGPGRFDYAAGRRRRIDDLILDAEDAEQLWRLLLPREEGGAGGLLYVCGRSGFARTVLDTLLGLFGRFEEGKAEERQAKARRHLRRLVGDGRLMQEVFTDARPADSHGPVIPVSELVLRNDHERGWWLLVDDVVYDVTEFIHQHPGGARILRAYAGVDGTDGYRRVHAGRSEVDAMREMYEIGRLQQPDFRHTRIEVARPEGAHTFALAAIYRMWVKTLFLVGEMQNALRADHHLQHAVTARDDPPAPRSFYKLQKAVETHERFVVNHVGCLLEQPLLELWAVTRGAFDAARDPSWLAVELHGVQRSEVARWVRHVPSKLHTAVRDLASLGVGPSDPRVQRIRRACEILEREDARLLAELKSALREAVRAFEQHQHELPERGADVLLDVCRGLPGLLETWYARIARQLRDEEGWEVELGPHSETPDTGEDGRKTGMFQSVVSTTYWDMQEDLERAVVWIKRSAVPVESLDELARQNEHMIASLKPRYATWGVVVDVRQAPARNDPAFENAMRRFRDDVSKAFTRRVVLLESAVGVLQVNRITRAEQGGWVATQSETQALQLATDGTPG